MWQSYEVRKPDSPEWDFARVTGYKDPWPYDKYLKSYWTSLVKYQWVRDYYDYDLPSMIAMIQRDAAFLSHTIPAIEIMQQCGVTSLLSFIDAVATRQGAEKFIAQVGFTPDALMGLLHQFRRFIPEPQALLKLILPDEDEAGKAAYQVFKAHKITTSYPMLERGRTKEARQQLAAETRLSEATVLDFARRADLSRLWMFGGMVKRLVMVGVRSMRDLQQADPHELRLKLEAYYHSIGMGVSIESTDALYTGLVEGVKRYPVIVED